MACLAALVACAAPRPRGPYPAPTSPPYRAAGRWLVAGPAAGETSGHRDLQPSGLVWRRGALLAIGDRNGRLPKSLLVIVPASAMVVALAIEEPESVPGEAATLAAYRDARRPDFEALALDPRDDTRLLTVTESDTQLLVTIRLIACSGGREPNPFAEGLCGARLEGVRRLVFDPPIEPWEGSENSRLEGLAFDGTTLYAALERAADGLPRLYRARLEPGAQPLVLEELALPWGLVPERADKPRARLSLNGLELVEIAGRRLVLGLARDQERLLLIDPGDFTRTRLLDLDLRSPSGEDIVWTSPEGIAVAGERVWVINDPAALEGNYRARATDEPEGPFRDYTPLLFELPLAALAAAPTLD